MLRRLKVEGFKSLRSVDVELAPLTVVFGPNAAGKSNLLEAMLVLSRLMTERTIADAFLPPFRGLPSEAFTLGEGGLSEMVGNGSAAFSMEADFERGDSDADGDDARLRYAVKIGYHPKTGQFLLEDEKLAPLNKRDWHPSSKKPIIERDPKDATRWIVRGRARAGRPTGEGAAQRFTVVSDPRWSADEWPLIEVARAEARSWRVYYLDPRHEMRKPQPPKDVLDIGSDGADLAPYLYRLKNDPQYTRHFAAVRRALSQAIPSIDDLDVVLDERYGTLDIQVRQDGVPLSSRVVSEGTLRVLSLCAVAASPSPPRLLAFEEPENGVHPARLDVVLDILNGIAQRGQEQVVVTTHSPRVVDEMVRRWRSQPRAVRLLLCRREGGATVITPFEPTGELFFADREFVEALDDEGDRRIGRMMEQGWLDG